MARRYRSILDHLGHAVGGEDIEVLDGFSEADADAFIVATPTESHAEILHSLKDCGRPILCEKPISKSLTQLETLLGDLKRVGTRIQMVSQYDYLIDEGFDGQTEYDYFKSGSDGLYWDCINIIKHARGTVSLACESPVWNCMINGQKLNLGLMDKAYVEMIDHWLRDPTRTDYDGIFKTHKKVHDLEARCHKS